MSKNLSIWFVILTLSQVVWAQQPELLSPVNLRDWDIPAGNYSGITPLGNDRYAVVSDKTEADGFYIFRVYLDSVTGKIKQIASEGFRGNSRPKRNAGGLTVRDCEDIIYVPESHSLFISGEGDQQILAYDTLGQPTGQRLVVPEMFANIRPNYGFEALGYDTIRHLFWTTTERALIADEDSAAKAPLLRIQSFGEDLLPGKQYAYRLDLPETNRVGRYHVHGVSAMTALPDGRLLVLERELCIPSSYVGASCLHKIFIIDPLEKEGLKESLYGREVSDKSMLPKILVSRFLTRLNLTHRDFANYEGMCLGPVLADGRRTLLLVSDSQDRYGNAFFRMKDYIRVIILPRF